MKTRRDRRSTPAVHRIEPGPDRIAGHAHGAAAVQGGGLGERGADQRRPPRQPARGSAGDGILFEHHQGEFAAAWQPVPSAR